MTDVIPGTERPGGSVDAEYRRALALWRRRVRRFLWPWITVGVLLLVLGIAVPSHSWGVSLAAVGGFMLGTALQLRDSPPTAIRNLGQGAEGERDTAKELERLGPGWTVRHDLNGRFGNHDHIAFGSRGVFILETKAWWGSVLEVTDAGPELSSNYSDWQHRREERLTHTMRARAAGMNQALRDLVKVSPWVTPVVVVWAEFPAGAVEHQGVWYVHGQRLSAWLEGRPERLSDVQLEKLARVLGGS